MQMTVASPMHMDWVWKEGAHQLAMALDRCGEECTPSQLKMMLARGEKQLLILHEDGPPCGWAVIEWHQLPNLRVMHIYAIFAPGQTLPEAFEQLKVIARQGGASAIQGACDPVVARLWQSRFDFKEQYRIMRSEL